MSLALLLGIVAAGFQVVAFALYNKNIFKKESDPNTSTWLMWAVLSVLNAFTYSKSTADPAKFVLSNVSAAATLLTFVYCLFWKKFKPIPPFDYAIIAVGTLGGVVWLVFNSVAYGNIIVVGAVLISFYPLYRGVWRNPRVEKPWPWYVWGLAYSVNTLVVVVNWRGRWTDLVYPVAMLLAHPPIGWLANRKPRLVR